MRIAVAAVIVSIAVATSQCLQRLPIRLKHLNKTGYKNHYTNPTRGLSCFQELTPRALMKPIVFRITPTLIDFPLLIGEVLRRADLRDIRRRRWSAFFGIGKSRQKH
jgi:hypothetical protein